MKYLEKESMRLLLECAWWKVTRYLQVILRAWDIRCSITRYLQDTYISNTYCVIQIIVNY